MSNETNTIRVTMKSERERLVADLLRTINNKPQYLCQRDRWHLIKAQCKVVRDALGNPHDGNPNCATIDSLWARNQNRAEEFGLGEVVVTKRPATAEDLREELQDNTACVEVEDGRLVIRKVTRKGNEFFIRHKCMTMKIWVEKKTFPPTRPDQNPKTYTKFVGHWA